MGAATIIGQGRATLYLPQQAAAPIPAAGTVDACALYFDGTDLMLAKDGGAYAVVAVGATGVTLDGAYDFGGAGAGRAIVADAGAVTITDNAANNTNVLELTKSPAAAQTGSALVATIGANVDDQGVVISHSGSTASTSTVALQLTGSQQATGLEFTDGQSLNVGAAGTARIRYNNASATLQVSLNGAAFTDFDTAAGDSLQTAYNAGPSVTVTDAIGTVAWTSTKVSGTVFSIVSGAVAPTGTTKGLVVDLSSLTGNAQYACALEVFGNRTTVAKTAGQATVNIWSYAQAQTALSVRVFNKTAFLGSLAVLGWVTNNNYENTGGTNVLTGVTHMLTLDGQTNVDAATNNVEFRAVNILVPLTSSTSTIGVRLGTLQSAGRSVLIEHSGATTLTAEFIGVSCDLTNITGGGQRTRNFSAVGAVSASTLSSCYYADWRSVAGTGSSHGIVDMGTTTATALTGAMIGLYVDLSTNFTFPGAQLVSGLTMLIGNSTAGNADGAAALYIDSRQVTQRSIDVAMRNTSGNLIVYRYGAGVTFTGTVVGLLMDLRNSGGNNGGAQLVIGESVSLPSNCGATSVCIQADGSSQNAGSLFYAYAGGTFTGTFRGFWADLDGATAGAQQVHGMVIDMPASTNANTTGITITTLQTAGYMMKMGYSGATTLTAQGNGLLIDMTTNLTDTGQNVVGQYTVAGNTGTSASTQSAVAVFDWRGRAGHGGLSGAVHITTNAVVTTTGQWNYLRIMSTGTVTLGSSCYGAIVDLNSGMVAGAEEVHGFYAILGTGTSTSTSGVEVATEQTAGFLFRGRFNNPTTQTSFLTGMQLDMSTNFTPTVTYMIGLSVVMPATTNSASNAIYVFTTQRAGNHIEVLSGVSTLSGTTRVIRMDLASTTAGAQEVTGISMSLPASSNASSGAIAAFLRQTAGIAYYTAWTTAATLTGTTTGYFLDMTTNITPSSQIMQGFQMTIGSTSASASTSSYGISVDWRGRAGHTTGFGAVRITTGATVTTTGTWTYLNIRPSSTVTLGAALTGINVDLQTTVTPGSNAVTGVAVLLPATTSSSASGVTVTSISTAAICFRASRSITTQPLNNVMSISTSGTSSAGWSDFSGPAIARIVNTSSYGHAIYSDSPVLAASQSVSVTANTTDYAASTVTFENAMSRSAGTMNLTGTLLSLLHYPTSPTTDTSTLLYLYASPGVAGSVLKGINVQMLGGSSLAATGYAARFDWRGTPGNTVGVVNITTGANTTTTGAITYFKIGMTATLTLGAALTGANIDLNTSVVGGSNNVIGAQITMPDACGADSTGLLVDWRSLGGTTYATHGVVNIQVNRNGTTTGDLTMLSITSQTPTLTVNAVLMGIYLDLFTNFDANTGGNDVVGMMILIPNATNANTRGLDIGTAQTGGFLINCAFIDAATLANTLTGIRVDLSTNVTGGSQTVVGLSISQPGAAITTSSSAIETSAPVGSDIHFTSVNDGTGHILGPVDGQLLIMAGTADSGAGNSVTCIASDAVDGKGGSIVLTAGDGVGTNKDGGDIQVTTGAPTGSGVKGAVNFVNDAAALGGGAAPTLGTIGGSGPAAAAQNEWLRVKVGSNVRFIPVWA